MVGLGSEQALDSSEKSSSAQSSADPQTALEEGSLGWAGRAAALEAARTFPVSERRSAAPHQVGVEVGAARPILQSVSRP